MQFHMKLVSYEIALPGFRRTPPPYTALCFAFWDLPIDHCELAELFHDPEKGSISSDASHLDGIIFQDLFD